MKLILDVSKTFNPKTNDIIVYDSIKGWRTVNKNVYEAKADKKIAELYKSLAEKEKELKLLNKELDEKIEKVKLSIVNLTKIIMEE